MRGLTSLTPSWVPVLAVLDSSGLDKLPFCVLAGLDSGYSLCVSLRWLLVHFHTFFYMILDSLRLLQDQKASFPRIKAALAVDICSGMCMAGSAGYVASYAVFPPLLGRPMLPGTMMAGLLVRCTSLCSLICRQAQSGLVGDFRIQRNAWIDSGCNICGSLRIVCGPSYLAVTCSVLYVADECTKMRIFWEFTSRVVSVFSAYLLDSGHMYGVSLRVLVLTRVVTCPVSVSLPVHSCFLRFVNGVLAGFAGYDAPRCPFDSGMCKAVPAFHAVSLCFSAAS